MRTAEVLLDRVSKTYGGVQGIVAVNGVTLEVRQGEFLTLLGPSGCGKTTLLRIVGGFLRPSTGRVFVGGEDVTDLPPQRRPTALVFQNYALFPHLTVAGNVAFGLRVRRLPKAAIASRLRECLAIVGLSGAEDRFPHQLSGGQQQRVALARALAVEPPVLLMDEPLGALDAKLREEMQLELRSIQLRLGITTIYVTHDQEEAFSMSDRVAVMSRGRILQQGSPDQIYRRPASVFVANFVGRSNLLRGVVSASEGRVRTADGHSLAGRIPDGLAHGAAAVVVVRPEDIVVGGFPGADNHLDGVIERRRFTGGAYLYHVRVSPGLVMTAEDRRAVPLALRDRVRLSWESSRSIVLPGSSALLDEAAEASTVHAHVPLAGALPLYQRDEAGGR